MNSRAQREAVFFCPKGTTEEANIIMDDADEKMRNGAGEEDVLFKLKYFNLSRFISYQCIKNSEMFRLNE